MTMSRDECSLARLLKQDCRATAKSLTRKWNKVTQKNVSERLLGGDCVHWDIMEASTKEAIY